MHGVLPFQKAQDKEKTKKNGPKQRGGEKQRVEGGEEAVGVVALHSTEWRGEEMWERGGSVVIPYSQPQVESIMENNESRIGYNSGTTILQQNFGHSHAQKLRRHRNIQLCTVQTPMGV